MSAWGASFGASWGVSWGGSYVPAPAPAPVIRAGGRNYIIRGKKYRNLKDEELLRLLAQDAIESIPTVEAKPVKQAKKIAVKPRNQDDAALMVLLSMSESYLNDDEAAIALLM